jgi:hypothetical protein
MDPLSSLTVEKLIRPFRINLGCKDSSLVHLLLSLRSLICDYLLYLISLLLDIVVHRLVVLFSEYK